MPDWRRLRWQDRIAWIIGSGFGSGFAPIAPGTAGSAVATVILIAIALLLPPDWPAAATLPIYGALIIVGFAAGVWATGKMSTNANPDPGTAVWDEFVGMWIAAVPAVTLSPTPFNWWLLAAFLGFRALDGLKPWPCRPLERLHGGWGIMIDDVAAALWTLLGLGVIYLILKLLTTIG